MTTLQQIIEKYNMANLAYDEMSDFERDILKYAEQEPTNPCDPCKFNTKLMLIEANVSGYAQGLKESSKTGHWIKIVVNGQHKIKCDKCDYVEAEYATHIRNYCPNCGADMRGDTNETDECPAMAKGGE